MGAYPVGLAFALRGSPLLCLAYSSACSKGGPACHADFLEIRRVLEGVRAFASPGCTLTVCRGLAGGQHVEPLHVCRAQGAGQPQLLQVQPLLLQLVLDLDLSGSVKLAAVFGGLGGGAGFEVCVKPTAWLEAVAEQAERASLAGPIQVHQAAAGPHRIEALGEDDLGKSSKV